MASDSVIASDLKQLRLQLRQARRSLSNEQQKQHALQAANYLLAMPIWQQSNLSVGVTASFDGELDLTPIISVLKHAHRLFLPCLCADFTLAFAPWQDETEMSANVLGIPEPTTNQRITIDQLDVVLVPLVGVDAQGNRLGMGAGYYDRSLGKARQRPYLIGVAHQCQQVERLPVQPWDIPLDALVTESGLTIWHIHHS
ncbi:MAG: 5-formyltetrahydrofolate cyclo-ligase [Thiotrichales bacterium]|nr:5-formyltetrahydrofolate cyclo-ligase [Thiotrichales bacterium]